MKTKNQPLKRIMFKQIFLSLVILFISFTSVLANNYIRDYTYKASDIDSKVTSRAIALDQVKIILLQEIGTYIYQKINITKDSIGNTYAKEDIEAITAGIANTEILEEKWNGETYYLKVKIEADSTQVLKKLKEAKYKDSKLLNKLKSIQEQYNSSRKEITKLKNRLIQLTDPVSKKEVKKDYVKEVNQLKINDMYLRASIYFVKGMDKDAFPLASRAAEQGHLGSQMILASIYDLGLSVKQDFEKALYWYSKASQQGSLEADIEIAWLYIKGNAVEKNISKGLSILQKIANMDNKDQKHQNAISSSQSVLGKIFSEGLIVKKDIEKGLKWFIKSTENSDFNTLFLGLNYERGMHGLSKDYKQAIKWYRKSAENNFPPGQYKLGQMYFKGYGVVKDYNKAFKWSRKAAYAGFNKAQAVLGEMYERGFGVEKDLIIAIDWYGKATEQGNLKGQSTLEQIYYEDNHSQETYQQVVYWTRKAAEEEFEYSQWLLGIMYLMGKGVDLDLEKSFVWLLKAAAQDFSFAQFDVGIAYLLGDGTEQNFKKAIYWLNKAADQDHGLAYSNLIFVYISGIDGNTKNINDMIVNVNREKSNEDAIEKDVSKAFSVLEVAILNNYTVFSDSLLSLLQQEIYDEKNKNLSSKWQKLVCSVSLEFPPPQYCLFLEK
jgi:TPR repeat protein